MGRSADGWTEIMSLTTGLSKLISRNIASIKLSVNRAGMKISFALKDSQGNYRQRFSSLAWRLPVDALRWKSLSLSIAAAFAD